MSSVSSLVDCYCGKRAVLRTSWTEINPGRRFHSCKNYNVSLFFFFVHLHFAEFSPHYIFLIFLTDCRWVGVVFLIGRTLQCVEGRVQLSQVYCKKSEMEAEILKLNFRHGRLWRQTVVLLVVCIMCIWVSV